MEKPRRRVLAFTLNRQFLADYFDRFEKRNAGAGVAVPAFLFRPIL